MQRWAGVHINGWHDHAARDWDIEDDSAKLENALVVDGGSGSVAVRLSEGEWLGGPQAVLSAHGRGKGWGDLLGSTEKRQSISDALRRLQEAPDTSAAQAIAGTAIALSRTADRLVVAVPDNPAFAEAAQGRMLAALKGPGRTRPVLLWRSVALFIAALDEGRIDRTWIGARVRLIIHDHAGLEIQYLTLAAADGFPGHVAPQRNGFGMVACPDLGLAALESQTRREIESSRLILAQGRIERTRLPITVLFGPHITSSEEILRVDNGNWAQIPVDSTPCDLGAWAGLPLTSEADVTVFATPLIDTARENLITHIRDQIPNVHVSPWENIARGALRAGRWIERGLPHYLDTLEPIALAVLSNDRAHFTSLIAQGKNVPANREYVSDPMGGFLWGKDKNRIEFYVLKGKTEVLKWVAESKEGPLQQTEVILQLRQTPGQSWAKLQATAPSWPALALHPIMLDWETLEPDARNPDEILASLQRPVPKIPERLVESAHVGFWDGTQMEPTVRDVLDGSAEAMYMALSQSRRIPDDLKTQPPNSGPKYHPVSTDGELPVGLRQDDLLRFNAAMDRQIAIVEAQLRSSRRLVDNRSFLALTWTFTRCPSSLQGAIVDSMEAYNRNLEHPLHHLPSASKILQQGGGRTVEDPVLLSRLLRSLTARPHQTIDTRGALSFVLSRRRHVAQALDASLVEGIAAMIERNLERLVRDRNFDTDFTYIINALVGLLRYREVSPWALVTDRSKVAVAISKKLGEAIQYLPRSQVKAARAESLVNILRNLMDFLEGTGGDPDILVQIDQL